MNYDDEFDEEYNDSLEDEVSDYDFSESHEILKEKDSERDFDPLDITNPVSAYFFLSDDVQDELQATGKQMMKCLSCGRKFRGEIYDSCPECFSPNTEEISSKFDYETETGSKLWMKCLSCGHVFQGDITDDCPECYNSDTEQFIRSIDKEDDYSV